MALKLRHLPRSGDLSIFLFRMIRLDGFRWAESGLPRERHEFVNVLSLLESRRRLGLRFFQKDRRRRAEIRGTAVAGHAAEMVPYFAVCLFAGLRPMEAQRLDWSRIRFEDGRIETLKYTSKVRRRRWAKIEANGLEWLKPHAKPSGLIIGFSQKTWQRHFNLIRIAAGMIPKPKSKRPTDSRVWDQDIMRHSFASYWLAVIMGNTVPIIRKHYENTVLADVADKFWAIRP